MWLAHLLTVSRLPLAGLFWLVVGEPRWALLVLLLAAATDIVDGVVARLVVARRRRLGRVPPSRVGEWLDPLCDKTFVLSVLAALAVRLDVPAGLLVVIAARELILVPLAALYRFTSVLRSRMQYRFRAGALGKAATVAQFLAIAALLFRDPRAPALAAVAAVVGVAAATAYVLRGVRAAHGQSRPALPSSR